MQNLKKVLALCLAVVLSVGLAVGTSAAFPDVSPTSKHAQAIEQLQMLGILGGDDSGKFNPTKTITRAEFVKVLYTALTGTTEAGLYAGMTVFTDVSAEQWHAGYINWAYANGIVGGRGDGTFGPDLPITLQEAAKMFVVAITGKNDYAWPYGYITMAKNLGLLSGVSGVSMSENAQRQIIAQMASNLLYIPSVLVTTYNAETGVSTSRAPIEVVFNIADTSAETETIILFGTSDDTRNGTGQTLITKAGQVSLGVIVNNGGTYEIDSYVFNYTGNVSSLIGAPVKIFYEEGSQPGWRYAKKIIDIQAGYKAKNDTSYNNISGTGPSSYTISGTKIAMDGSFDFNSGFLAATTDGGYRLGAMRYYYLTNNATMASSSLWAPASSSPITTHKLEYLRQAISVEPVTFYDIDGDGDYDFISADFKLSAMKVNSVSNVTNKVSLGRSIGSVELFDGAIVDKANIQGYTPTTAGEYVNGTLKVNYDGKFIYTLSPSTVRKGVTFTGSIPTITTLYFDGSAVYIAYMNQEHGPLSDIYSRSPAVPNYMNIGKKFDLVLTHDGRLAAVIPSAGTGVSTSGLSTAVVTDIGRDDSIVPNYNITLKLPDGTLKNYPLAASARLYHNYKLEIMNSPSASGNGWIKGGSDVPGSLVSNIIISAGKAAITGSLVHYEVADGKVTVVTALEEIGNNLPTGATLSDWNVTSSSTQSWNKSLGAFRNNEQSFLFPSADLVAYRVESGNYKAYTITDLPEFTSAQVTNIVYKDSVIAMVFDAWVAEAPAMSSNIGTIASYTIEAGSASGKAKLNITAIIDGTKNNYYTGEFDTSVAEAKKTEANAAINFFSLFDLTADNTIKEITPFIVSDSGTDFTYAVVSGKVGGFYNFKPVYEITSSNIKVADTGSYIMLDDTAKIYTVGTKPAAATVAQIIDGAKIATSNSTLKKATLADVILTTEAEAQYVVAYLTKTVDSVQMIDTMVVYTTYIGGETVAARTLTGISITTLPTKIAYYSGERFNAAGMVVTANYSDSTTAIVTGYTLSNTLMFAEDTATTQDVTISFKGMTTVLTVDVEPMDIEELTIVNLPVDTYLSGQELNLNGVILHAVFDSGAEEDITEEIDYVIVDGGVDLPRRVLRPDDEVYLTFRGARVAATVSVEYPSEVLMLVGSWYRNVGSSTAAVLARNANQFVFCEAGVVPTAYSSLMVKNAAQAIAYADDEGYNIDDYVGSAVLVSYVGVDEPDTVLRITPLDSTIIVPMSSFTSSGGKYYAGGVEIEFDMNTIQYSYSRTSAAIEVGAFTVQSAAAFNGDEELLFSDLNGDGIYDYVVGKFTLNGIYVGTGLSDYGTYYALDGVGVPNACVGTIGTYIGASPLYVYNVLDDIKPGDFVNADTITNIAIAGRDRLHANVSRADILNNMTLVSKNASEGTFMYNGKFYANSYTFSNGTDTVTLKLAGGVGLNDGGFSTNATYMPYQSAAIAPLADAAVGDKLTLVLDRADNIVKAFAETGTLTGIEIASPANITAFVVGDPLDITGLRVKANYSSGASILLSDDSYTIDVNMNTSGHKDVTINYLGQTATYRITVVGVIDYLEVSTPPTNLIQFAGETFDSTGMVLTAHFVDGGSMEIESGYTAGALVAGATTVTISYAGSEATVTGLTIGTPKEALLLLGTETNNYKIYSTDTEYQVAAGKVSLGKANIYITDSTSNGLLSDAYRVFADYDTVAYGNVDALVGQEVWVSFTNSDKDTVLFIGERSSTMAITADDIDFLQYIPGGQVPNNGTNSGYRADLADGSSFYFHSTVRWFYKGADETWHGATANSSNYLATYYALLTLGNDTDELIISRQGSDTGTYVYQYVMIPESIAWDLHADDLPSEYMMLLGTETNNYKLNASDADYQVAAGKVGVSNTAYFNLTPADLASKVAFKNYDAAANGNVDALVGQFVLIYYTDSTKSTIRKIEAAPAPMVVQFTAAEIASIDYAANGTIPASTYAGYEFELDDGEIFYTHTTTRWYYKGSDETWHFITATAGATPPASWASTYQKLLDNPENTETLVACRPYADFGGYMNVYVMVTETFKWD